ncbi:DUF2291 family protein [Confluentibacter lentus]|uniref:DUF2291 family protein n=1 Tax=Confluentibacter lentus TaxID=1699412 RepID=UPI000C281C80|nr:DUF2291 family protein [Confluentibacter lentus]
MSKLVKYFVFIIATGLLLYSSISLEPLDKHKIKQDKNIFSAKDLAANFMLNETSSLPAIDASDFLEGISKNVNEYCSSYGKKLGISSDYNFIIEGIGTVESVKEEDVLVSLVNSDKLQILIATDFIFGNTIRDASGIADIGDFQNTMDFNNISVELNNIVRETIVPSFKQKVKEGDTLYFKGAVEVNIKRVNLQKLRVIPLIVKFNN